jgi:hypothetical protein
MRSVNIHEFVESHIVISSQMRLISGPLPDIVPLMKLFVYKHSGRAITGTIELTGQTASYIVTEKEYYNLLQSSRSHRGGVVCRQAT